MGEGGYINQIYYIVCCIITPPPVGGRGIVIERFLCFFVCLFVCLFIYFVSATLRENGWTDLHEIFRKGVWSDHGTT